MRDSGKGRLKIGSSAESYATGAVLLLTAILSVIGSFASEYARRWWYPYLAGGFILLGLAVLVQRYVRPWIGPVVAARRERRARRRTAHELFPALRDIVRHFQDFLNTQSDGTLGRYLEVLRAQEPEWRHKLPPAPPLMYLGDFFARFFRRLGEWDGSYRQFNELAQEFHEFLHQYDRLHVRDSLAALRALPNDQLPDQRRRKINLLREQYLAFLNEYVRFAKAANSRLGVPVFNDYVDLPEAM